MNSTLKSAVSKQTRGIMHINSLMLYVWRAVGNITKHAQKMQLCIACSRMRCLIPRDNL